MPRRRPAPLALASLAALVLLAGGCGRLKGVVQPDQPPHTTLFIYNSPVDTVNHLVHLYWFGTDADGRVVGFEVRLLHPLQPADTAWRFTQRTDSLITVLAPTGYAEPAFEVRAIDDAGLRDPHPARQVFKLSNSPPVVKLTMAPGPSDFTFASVTVGWVTRDPDGDASKILYLVWLDGHATDPDTTTGRTFTVPTARFRDPQSGALASGYRTLYVRAIDDGGMAGPVDSVRWYVQKPVAGSSARLLILDDVDPNAPGKLTWDNFYARGATDAGLAAGTYTIWHLKRSPLFRSSMDVYQTMKLFDAVVWYGLEPLISDAPGRAVNTVLRDYQAGIGRYLDEGGRVYLEGLNLAANGPSSGELTPDFLSRYLNAYGVFKRPVLPDSIIDWTINLGVVFRLPSPVDSLLNSKQQVRGVNTFKTRDAGQIFMIAPRLALSPANEIPQPCALRVPQSNLGLLIANTYPLVYASFVSTTPPFPDRGRNVLANIYGQILSRN